MDCIPFSIEIIKDGGPDILFGEPPMHDDCSSFYEIKMDGKTVGGFGLSWYADIRATGLGSFELYTEYRHFGLGFRVLGFLVSALQGKSNLLYCYVEPNNLPAIHLYGRIGKVFFDRRNRDGLLYVELFNKEKQP